MIRLVRAALVAGAGLSIVLGAVIGYFAWHLRREPLALTWLRPYIAARVIAARPGMALTIGDIQLWWHAETRRIELRAIDVHLRHDPSSQELVLPAVALHPRLGTLWRGRVELDHLTLIAPRLAVLRTEEGVTLRTSSTPPPNQSSSAPALTTPELLQQLHQVCAQVGSIEVRGGEISIDDRPLAHTWSVRQLRGKLGVDATRLAVHAEANVHSGPLVAPLSLRVTEREASRIEVVARIDDLVPAALQQGIPAGSGLKLPPAVDQALDALSGPIRAETSFAIGPPGLLDGPVRIAIHGDRFAVESATHGLALRDGKLLVAMEMAGDATTINDLSLALPDMTLTATGKLTRLAGHSRLEARASIARFPVSAIRHYWPTSVLPAGRRWVTENITAGTVKNIRAAATLALGTTTETEHLDLHAALDDVTVRFAPAMPPATDVDATVAVSKSDNLFTVQRGRLEGLEITGGTVAIRRAHGPDPARIDLDVAAHGPLANALAVLDHDPVNLGRALGVSPDEVDGTMRADVRVRVPFGGAVSVSGIGHLDAVTLHRPINGWPVTAGRFDVRLDADTVQADGELELATVPASLNVRHVLGGAKPTVVQAQAVLDARARAALGIDLGESISGSAPVRATITAQGNAPWSIDLAADLAGVAFSPPLSAFGKAAGKPGRAFARLQTGAGSVRIDPFDINAGGTVAQGSAEVDAEGWQSLHATLRVPASRKSKVATVDVSGRRDEKGSAWSLRSDDAGAVVDQLLTGDARGGSLRFDCTVRPGESGAVTAGRFEIHDIHFVTAPVFARILALGSLTGLMNAMTSGGMRFARIQSDIAYERGVVRLDNGRGDADALAILASGSFDTRARRVDVLTSVIPSYYGLNTAAQKIPILGRFVEKATGEALQIIDARVHGSFDAPAVTIAPTSLVAPEILKEQLRSWQGQQRQPR